MTATDLQTGSQIIHTNQNTRSELGLGPMPSAVMSWLWFSNFELLHLVWKHRADSVCYMSASELATCHSANGKSARQELLLGRAEGSLAISGNIAYMQYCIREYVLYRIYVWERLPYTFVDAV